MNDKTTKKEQHDRFLKQVAILRREAGRAETQAGLPRDMWGTLALQLEELRSTLCWFEILGEADFEQIKLNRLTYGLVKAPRWLKADYDAAIYIGPHTKRPEIRELWLTLTSELGTSRAEAQELERRDYFSAPLDHFAIATQAISDNRIDLGFLESWARLHELKMQYFMLMTFCDPDEVVDQKLAGALQSSTLIQQHWYAWWVSNNAPTLAPEDRAEADTKLGELCLKIKTGKLLPHAPYPKSWYEALLGVNIADGKKQGRGDLDRTDDIGMNFRKLGEPTLRKLLGHKIITSSVLPPLKDDDFKKP